MFKGTAIYFIGAAMVRVVASAPEGTHNNHSKWALIEKALSPIIEECERRALS